MQMLYSPALGIGEGACFEGQDGQWKRGEEGGMGMEQMSQGGRKVRGR